MGNNHLSVVSNDMTYYPRDGGEPVPLRMPKVAESWAEFCKMLAMTEGESAEGTLATTADAISAAD